MSMSALEAKIMDTTVAPFCSLMKKKLLDLSIGPLIHRSNLFHLRDEIETPER